jgi:hypothetical protein
LLFELRVDDGVDGRKGGDDEEVEEHLRVHLPLYPASFGRGHAGVHDDLGLLAREEDDADHPGRVAQDGAAEEHSLEIRRRLLPIRESDSRIKPIHVRLRSITVDREARRAGLVRTPERVVQARKLRHRVPALEVGLPIQVLRLHVRDVVVVARRADEDVGRERLVLVDLDKVADFDVFKVRLAPVRAARRGVRVVVLDIGVDRRGNGGVRGVRRGFRFSTHAGGASVGRRTLDGRFAAHGGEHASDEGLALGLHHVRIVPSISRQDFDSAMIDSVVRLMTLEVLITIFQGRQCEDDSEWEDDDAR